jgi:hypothetical protein
VAFVGAAAQDACLDLNLPAGHTAMVYASFLLTLTDISAVSTSAANNPFAAFIDDPTPQPNSIGRLGGRIVTKKVGSGYVLGTSKSATTTDFIYEPTASPHNVGDVLFIVMGYQRVVATQTTNVFLWVNPPVSSFGSNQPPTPTLTATSGLSALNNNARGFALLCAFATAPSGIIDDLRVTTNDWAGATAGAAIYIAPTNVTVNASSNATFSVKAFGGSPPSYQWLQNGNPMSDAGNVSGSTTSTLSISNVFAADAASYSVVVSNIYSVTTSAAATLTVSDPWISVQPTNQAVNPGATVALHVVAVGTPTLTYQWYKDTSPLSDTGNISGSQSANLTITSFSSGNAGTYNVVVFNGSSTSITSSNAVIGLTDPSITAQPQSITNVYGTTATFQVTASGTAPLTYLWHKVGFGDLSDGGNISGSHSNILTLTGVAGGDSGTYSVTVSNAIGSSVDSSAAVLTVRDPAITTQPLSATNFIGGTAIFHAVAVGTPGLTYEWFKGASIIFDDGVKYVGAFTDTLSISNLNAADQDTYTLTVINGNSASENSVPATLTVVSPPTPIAITEQPTARNVLAGSRTAVGVGITGSSPQYQWLFGGVTIPGASAASYVLTNVQPAVTGSYQVIVSNAINAQTSSAVTVSIVSSLHIYPTNVVAIRVGDGAQTLTTNGNSMFLDQWAPDGTYLTTMSVPDNGATGIVAIGPTLTVTPSSVTGNSLSRSANGRFLVIGGYNTNLSYPSGLQNASATIVPRGIAFVDDQAQYTLAISSANSSSGNFWRGAAADGTNNYWGFSRTASTYYFGFDQPGLVIQALWSNLRSMGIFNGRLYGVSAVAGKTGVMRFAGLPTVAESVEVVVNTGSSGSSDCEVSPDTTVIYVADSDAAGAGGGIQRWQFDGSNWNLAYTLNDNLPVGAYYVAADFSGATPVVYAVTADAENNQIVRFSDTGAGASGTIVAYAGASQNFRGIRLGPAATTNTTQPLLSETPSAGAVTLNWGGSFFLQSATNVSGPYTDVINGTRPYTNTISGPQKFFRLRQ